MQGHARPPGDAFAAQVVPFRWIVENLDDAVGVLEPDGRVAYLSPAVKRLSGWEPEELVGRDGLEHVHPDDRPAVQAALQAALAQPGSPQSVHYRFRTKAGAWRDFLARGSAMPLAGGAQGILFVAQDVSERKRGEEAQRLVEAIVQSSQDAIITTDPRGNVTTWSRSAERMFGFTAEEVLGTSCLPFIPEDLVAEIVGTAEAILNGAVLQNVQTVRLHKDGTRVPLSMTMFPLRDPDGRVMGLASLSRDMRDHKVAAEAIEAQAAMRVLFRRTLRGGARNDSSMRETGRRLAREVGAHPTMESYAVAFTALGLGDLRLVQTANGRHVFAGTDLLEIRPGSAQPTCALPLGFLEAASGILAGGEGLCTELECQSLGHARCLFVVRARPVTGPGPG